MNTIHSHHIGHAFFIVGVFLLLIASTIISPLNTQKINAFGVSDIIEQSNKARKQLNVDPLTIDNSLMSAAQMKAEDMAKGHYFAHTAPDGTVPWDYFGKVNYTYEVAGENLAVTNQDATNVINGWLNSPAHRENLLSNNYNNMGVGMAAFGEYEGHNDTSVVVVMYGKRSVGTQALTAPTSPAGTMETFKSGYKFPPTVYIFAVAGILVIVGLLFELRHIKKLHQSHHIA